MFSPFSLFSIVNDLYLIMLTQNEAQSLKDKAKYILSLFWTINDQSTTPAMTTLLIFKKLYR